MIINSFKRQLAAMAAATLVATTAAPAHAVVAGVDSVSLNLGSNGGAVSAVTVNDVILADLTLPTSAVADAIRTGWNSNGGSDPVDASMALGNYVITDGLLNTNATIQFGQNLALNDVLVFMEIDTQFSEGVTFFPVDSGGSKIGDYSLVLANDGDRSSDYGPQLVPGNFDLKIVDVADPLANYNVRGVSFSLSDFTGSNGNLALAQGLRVEDVLGGVGVDPSFAAIAGYLPPNADFVAPAGVGIEDFNVLRSNYLESGLTQADGDANFDGVIDQKDYFLWRTDFLAAGGSMEGLSLFGAAVPEPSALGVVAVATTLLGARRRVGRRGGSKQPRRDNLNQIQSERTTPTSSSISASLFNKACVVAATALLTAHAASGQNPLGTRIDWIGEPGVEEAWDEGDAGSGEGANWADVEFGNLQPNGQFDEYASISLQGGAGRAVIDHPITFAPTDILLGQDAGSTGALIFRDGGSINLQPNGLIGNGELAVGAGGTGNLGLEDDMGAVTVRKYTQGNGGVLVARIGGASGFANHVTSSGGIALDGRLIVEQLDGSDFQFSSGDSWTLISGSAVTGRFDQVTVEPQLLGNPGQTIDVSTSGDQVEIAVGQRLVLEVDRYTGGAVLKNWEGHSTDIEIIDYTLSSTAGNLNSSAARWRSLADDASKPGWAKANPSSTALSELNDTSASLVFASGDTHDFGAPFDVNIEALLGVDRLSASGVAFEYLDPDTGVVQTAAIRTVGRYNDLVLAIDPVTGAASIQNQSGQAVNFVSYTISSESGSLQTSYTGIEGGAGPDWHDANSTSENLSELSDGPAAMMAPLAVFDLGAAWDAVNGEQDLTFVYQDPITGLLTPGTVYYGEVIAVTAVPGDYNGDGDVNAADYTLWRDNEGGDGSAFAPNTRGAGSTGPIGPADYDFWRANYGRTSASPGVASVAQAPEPGVLLLLGLGCVALGGRRPAVARRQQAIFA